MITLEQAAELRKLQDELIGLAQARGIALSTRVTGIESAPTVSDLMVYVYPDYEEIMRRTVEDMKAGRL